MRQNLEETFNTSRGRITFHLTQLGGIHAGRVLVRIGPHIPKLLGTLSAFDLKSLANPEALKKLDLSKLDFTAIGKAIADITPDEFERLTIELLSGSFATAHDPEGTPVRLDLTRGNVDQLFVGHVWDLFKLLGFAIKVNFADFGGGLRDPA